MVDPDDDAAQAEVANWELPPTVKRFSRQPALLYRAPKDFPRTRLTKKGQSKQIDLLSDGYCLVGGTHMLGMPLSLDSLAEPAMAPNALIERFKGWMPAPIPEPTPVDPSGDPPVRLNREGLEWWLGVKYQPGANGVVDRSATLFRLGCILARAGATEGTIAAALQERDSTLYGKYTDRRDAPIRYAEIARKAFHSASNGHIPGDLGETVYAPPGEIPLSNEPEWPAMQVLGGKDSLPHMDPDMIPGALQPWLVDISRQGSFPLEMVACPAIVSVGAVVGRKLGIKPYSFNDYIVVPNLWGGINSNPGTLKSFALRESLVPFKKLASRARDRYQTDKELFEAEVEMLKLEVEALKTEMKALASNDKKKIPRGRDIIIGDLAKKQRDLADAAITEHRYWLADSTPEKLQMLLKENPNGLLVIHDEMTGWLQELERDSQRGGRAFYLAAWEGLSDHYVDRVTRESIYIENCIASIVGGIQPDRLQPLIEESMAGGSGGDGFIQRFQLMPYMEEMGAYVPPTQWPNHAARKVAEDVFAWLDHEDLGGKRPLPGEGIATPRIPFLLFDESVQKRVDEWKTSLENRLRDPELGRTPAFLGHMGKWRSLMPSLALIFHLIDLWSQGSGPAETFPPVSEGAFDLAVQWCELMEYHARRMYVAELSPGSDAGEVLAEKILSGMVAHGESLRDLRRHEWEGLETTDKLEAGIQKLEILGWVRIATRQGRGSPSRVIMLHPDLREN